MKKILLVVDMQNGFARYNQTFQLTKKIGGLLELDVFDAVVATRFLNGSNSTYERLFDCKRLEKEEERALFPGYDKYIDYVFGKYIYNCINASFVQKLCQLNEGEYSDMIFIVGVDTDCCVLAIATGLFENNIRPIVLTIIVDPMAVPTSTGQGLRK